MDHLARCSLQDAASFSIQSRSARGARLTCTPNEPPQSSGSLGSGHSPATLRTSSPNPLTMPKTRRPRRICVLCTRMEHTPTRPAGPLRSRASVQSDYLAPEFSLFSAKNGQPTEVQRTADHLRSPVSIDLPTEAPAGPRESHIEDAREHEHHY